MSGRWKMFVDDRPWDGGRRLFMRVESFVGGVRSMGFVQPMTIIAPPPGSPVDAATLSENREEQEDACGDVTGFLQAALDAAWELGMRPLAYADHTHELKAVRYHLEDMRALAKVPPRPTR